MSIYPQKVSLDELELFHGPRPDDTRQVLAIRGRGVDLSPKVLLLLKELLEHRGSVVRRERLIEALQIRGEHKGQTLNEYMRHLKIALRQHQVDAVVATADEVGYALCTFVE